MSAIRNNHYWAERGQAHIGYSRMLSVRDEVGKKNPASLRNLILFHYRENNSSAINDFVKKFRSPIEYLPEPVQPSTSRNTNTVTNNQPDIPTEDNPVRSRKRRALTEEDILRNINIMNPTLIAENRKHIHRTAQIESGI